MQLSWLQSHFENSSSIGLLRSPHAAYLIDFFCLQFKRSVAGDSGGEIYVGRDALLRGLTDYLERLHTTLPDVLTNTAEHYLAEWCGPGKRYLRRFLDADVNEPLYELTSSTEDVITFLDQVARRESQFVGTESRLKRIIATLSDLAVGASEDSETRLTHLRQQRSDIDAQIAALESGGDVQTYHDTAIRERFAGVMSDLVQLQGDFRAVEDRFKEITREVQKRQLVADATRGDILGEALDAEDGLRGEDQGVSFDEFAKLILSPAKQEHLDGVIREVIRLEGLAAERDGIARVRDMVPSLTAEARKVLRTHQRLSTTLRRLLDREAHGSRQRLASVLDEIRSMGVQLADDPDREASCSFAMEQLPTVALPLERPVWSPPTEFGEVAMRTSVIDDDDRLAAFSDLAMMKSLDWNKLRKQIAGATTDEDVSLQVLLEQSDSSDRPNDTYDAVDVMGLIQIAHEDLHTINHRIRQRLRVRLQEDRTVELEVPEVVFRNRVSPDGGRA